MCCLMIKLGLGRIGNVLDFSKGKFNEEWMEYSLTKDQDCFLTIKMYKRASSVAVLRKYSEKAFMEFLIIE